MICSLCGYINNEDQEICLKCKQTLPKIKRPPQITARYVEIQLAVNNLLYGQITTSEFKEFLDKTTEFFLEKYREIKEMDIPDEIYGDLRREIELGLLGIETYISSIDLLRKYLICRKTEILEEGIKTAQKANDLLNTALTLNWQNHNAFIESTEEYLRQMSPDF